jgi:hypothetical protein
LKKSYSAKWKKKTLEHAGRTWYILLFTFYFLSAPASCTPHHVSFYFLRASCILHRTPHTLHPAPRNLHPATFTQHPEPLFSYFSPHTPHFLLLTFYFLLRTCTPHPTPVHFYFIPNTLHPASHTLRTFSSLLFTAPPPTKKIRLTISTLHKNNHPTWVHLVGANEV